jgi:hypothetical protein
VLIETALSSAAAGLDGRPTRATKFACPLVLVGSGETPIPYRPAFANDALVMATRTLADGAR